MGPLVCMRTDSNGMACGFAPAHLYNASEVPQAAFPCLWRNAMAHGTALHKLYMCDKDIYNSKETFT